MDSLAENLEGLKVSLTSDGSKFTGTVSKVDQLGGKIILRSVTTGGAKLCGPQHFHIAKIEDLEFENDAVLRQKKSPPKKKENSKGSIQKKKLFQPHLSKLRNLDTDDLVTARCIFSESDDAEPIVEEEYEDFETRDDCTLINRICEKFYDAIVYIMDQESVAVTFEGVDISRDGELSLIQVATETDIIIFDMIRLGEQAFVEGLHAFFESEKVCKVIHDCRWISDMLYHVFGVHLKHVFDTQVACAYVYSVGHDGDWPRHVESLDGALKNHLDLSHEQVFSLRIGERSKRQDQEMWLMRPLPEKLLELSTINIRYLMKLQTVLQRKMMLVFKVGVDLYLDHVRGASPGTVQKLLASSYLLPSIFTEISSFVTVEINQSLKHSAWQDKKHCSYDKNGFRANSIKVANDDVISSHDSIWHRSEEAYKAFRKRPTNPNSEYTSAHGLPPEEKERRKRVAQGSDQEKGKCDSASNVPSMERARTGSSPSKQRVIPEHLRSSPSKERFVPQHSHSSPAKERMVAKQSHSSPTKQAVVPEHARFSPLKERLVKQQSPSLHSTEKAVEHVRSSELESLPEHLNSGSADYIESFTATGRSNCEDASSIQSMPNLEPVEEKATAASKIHKSKLFQLISAQKTGVNKPVSDKDKEDKSPQPQTVPTCAQRTVTTGLGGEPKSIREAEQLDEELRRYKRAMDQLDKLSFEPVQQRVKTSTTSKTLSYRSDVVSPPQVVPDTNLSQIEGCSSGKSYCSSSCSDGESFGQRDGDVLNFLPAGSRHSSGLGRKKARIFKEKSASYARKDLAELGSRQMPALVSAKEDEEEDMGTIPMQRSLKRESGVRTLDAPSSIGDPFAMTEPDLSTAQALLSKDRLTLEEAGAISDSDIQKIEQMDVFKKTLKLASSVAYSESEIKSLFVPSKVKLSPKPGSS